MRRAFFIAVMAAAAAVLAYQLFLPPIVGLADQGDFVRTIGRFGYGPQHRGSLEYLYVEPKYIPDAQYRAPYWEQANSEYLFVGAALLLNKLVSKDGALDITIIGLVHALTFLAVFARLLWVARRHQAYGLLWIGALVALTDAGYAVYWNSFYAEPASCIFFLLLLGEAAILSRDPQAAGPQSMLRWSLWAILWVFAKPQNAPIGLLLGLFTFRMAFWTRPGRGAIWARVIAVAGACGMLGCAAYSVAGMPAVGRMANTYGMVFAGVLPDSKDPAADLRALGLDPQLAKYSGSGAWSPGTDFPALAESGVLRKVNTFTILRFYLLRPARLWRRLHGVLPRITFLRPPYGNFEPSAGLAPEAKSRAFNLWSGFHEHVLPACNKWIVFALAGWLLGAAWVRIREPGEAERRRIELLALPPACALAALAGAVFGDAFDLVKHLYLFNLLLDACVLYAAATGCAVLMARVTGPRPRGSA